jgi:hypothetical protein
LVLMLKRAQRVSTSRADYRRSEAMPRRRTRSERHRVETHHAFIHRANIAQWRARARNRFTDSSLAEGRTILMAAIVLTS